MILLILVAVFGAIVSGHSLPGSGKVVNGKDVDITNYPYQLSFEYYGGHLCGASLISSKYVVTAAHCTDGHPASSITIRAGTSIRNYDGKVLEISKLIQHPNYDPLTLDYDISILELAQPIVFTNKIRPIQLASENDKVSVGAIGTVSGWGLLGEGGSPPSQLQAVDLPIIAQNDCTSYYSDFTDRMFCAGYKEGGKDSCQGDSGGPFVVDGKLFGVVSFGDGCARPMKPGVYANVANLRSFIRNVTNI